MQDITFNGLTSTLRGNIYSSPTTRKLGYVFYRSHGNVGSVPSEWLNNVPIQNRESFIQNLYKLFSKIVDIQRTKIFPNKKCNQLLKDFFIENGVIEGKSKLRFKYAGYGDFADVVSFNVGKKKYALKIFKRDTLLENVEKEFGNFAEQNNAAFLNASEDSDWTKFYFGNVFERYMITRYVSTKDALPRKKIDISDRGLEFLDYDYKNIKLGTNIDYGGFRKLKDFPVGNKVATWIIKRIKKLPVDERAKEIEQITRNKKVPNYYDRMLGVKYAQKHLLTQANIVQTAKENFWTSLIKAFMGMYQD